MPATPPPPPPHPPAHVRPADKGDSGELTLEQVRASIKRTRYETPTVNVDDLEMEIELASEGAVQDEPAAEADIGTETVILEGAPLLLNGSVSADQVKAMLKQTREQSRSCVEESKAALKDAGADPDSRIFKLTQKFKKVEEK